MTSTNPPDKSESADPGALRAAFGAFMTGVTVVTTLAEDGVPVGFTANSFTSVSLDPPLILICIAKTSQNIETFQNAPGYAVNILAEGQEDLSRRFSGPVADRFAGVEWQEGPAGAPVIAGACSWFDCDMHDQIEAGDHIILIGEVKGFDHSARPALGYVAGGYFRL
jgi:flavin reductase (DIM6/NTAB) family NADH-FMN oxidoreductase RutF